MPPGREGSRCLTRQEQVVSYSRALVVTAATATMLRAAVLLRRMSLSRLERLRKYDRIQLLVFVVGQPPLAPRYV